MRYDDGDEEELSLFELAPLMLPSCATVELMETEGKEEDDAEKLKKEASGSGGGSATVGASDDGDNATTYVNGDGDNATAAASDDGDNATTGVSNLGPEQKGEGQERPTSEMGVGVENP